MAYTSVAPAGLSLMDDANGFHIFRYDSDDAITTVDLIGYFNNADDALNMAVGDMVLVVDWNSGVRSGTINGWGWHIVMTVSDAGVVDLAEATAGNVTNAD